MEKIKHENLYEWKFLFEYHFRVDTEYKYINIRKSKYYYIRFGNYHLCVYIDPKKSNQNSIRIIINKYDNSIKNKLIKSIKRHSNDSELINKLKMIINDENAIILMVSNDSAILYQQKCSIISQLSLQMSVQFSCKINNKILCILKYQFLHSNSNITKYINEWSKEKIIKESSNILINEIEPQLTFDILWNFNYSNHSLQKYIYHKKNAKTSEMLHSLLELITNDGTFNQIIGMKHLSSLKVQMNDDAIQILLKIIDERLSRNICDKIMIMAFNVMKKTNYDLLLKKGLNRFVSCLNQFRNNSQLIETIFSLFREIYDKSIDSLINYVYIFDDYLNSSFDSIAFNSTEILSLIINNREIFQNKKRIMIKMRETISKWNLNAKIMINFTSFKIFYHLLNSNYDVIQYFAIWMLTYLTRYDCQLYRPMIKMGTLNKVMENRKTKIYVLNLTKLLYFQCKTFSKYGHLNGIKMSDDIEIFKFFNNRQSFIYYKSFDLITNHWKMFKIFTYEFISKIRYVSVYDINSAILVNDDDDTFIAKNENIEKIPILCKKGIFDFSLGYIYDNPNSDSFFGHLIALNRNGEIFGYGNNKSNQIMNCDEKFIKNPVKITFNGKVKQTECGCRHTMVVTDKNDIFTWGDNQYGQCGNGTNKIVESPFNVKINENSNIKSIVCGTYHSLILYGNGTVYGWGDNAFCQLGLGTNPVQLKPIKVLENIKQIVCGRYHTLALTNDGFVYAMGLNNFGQLGNGNTNDENIPIKIEMKFKEIAANNFTSMGIDLNEECYFWGRLIILQFLNQKKSNVVIH
jgi:hypothetical protein